MKRILGAIALAGLVGGCATVDDRRVENAWNAFPADSRAADCDRIARRAWSAPSDEAREWAAGSTKPAIDRELRRHAYRDCLDDRG